MEANSRDWHMSPLAAWAFAFGTAVGWGSFVMPGVTFLPMAGPAGTVLGVLAGGAVMAVIAWNYHYMIGRMPGTGGAYSFASKAFGLDHGFLCAGFLFLAYVGIIWANATALTIVARYIFGDLFRVGFHYSIKGYDVYFGDIMLSCAAMAAGAAICCGRRLSAKVQTVMALVFVAGVAVCFLAAMSRCEGGLGSIEPAFAPDGSGPVAQILKIVALAPWLFIGFESISHLSGEFRFPRSRAFAVMLAAIAAAVAVYALLAVMPALVPGEGFAGWPAYIAHLGEIKGGAALPTFHAASRALGRAGMVAVGLTTLGAVFTNLVGNMAVASRLLSSMADDHILPAWFGHRSGDGAPRNAILAIAALSFAIPFLGRTAIGFIVDVSTVGAAIAYGYTSAAAFRTAKDAGDRLTGAVGIFGLILSAVMCALFVLPNYFSGSMMATESYLVIVLWCVIVFAFYRTVFGRDREHRFGHSTVVWITLLMMILCMSHMWLRQITCDITAKAFDGMRSAHDESCDLADGECCPGHAANMRDQLEMVKSTLARDGVTQGVLTVVALAIMFSLYGVLRRRERELEREKTAARSYFFSTVSHDIRTPLNAIIGFSEMLKAGLKTEEERNQALDAIMLSGKTLLSLINDVLDLSKLESGKMQIDLKPTDCHRLFHELIDAMRVSGGAPGLELRCHMEPMPLLMLDPLRIRQIAFNIVGNAVKFTEKGSVEVRASYEREPGAEKGIFRFDVEDTGCGVSEEDIKRLGSAYVQVAAKFARNGGTGLGLAICNHLVAEMGGEMKVESELGKGSTFSIILHGVSAAPGSDEPAAQAPEETIVTTTVAPKPEAPAGAQATAAAPAETASPRRVLIVDDSKMNLMVLKALLKKTGDFEVVLAMDGQEAMQALEGPGAKPFDLVLTDMWMPNKDGEGLVKDIRGNPALSSIRVLVVTADVEIKDKSAAMGFDGILLKPVTSQTLCKALAGGDK